MESSLVKKLDGAFLSKLERLGRTRALARAFEQAGVYFALFLTFSLSFWISGIEVVNGVQVGYALTVSPGRALLIGIESTQADRMRSVVIAVF